MKVHWPMLGSASWLPTRNAVRAMIDRDQIIIEPFAMRVIFMNVKEVIRKECNAIDYCQKNFMDLSSLRPNTQVSLSDRKLTLVRHKISQAKHPVSHSFYQQFLCHFVGHVLTCFIHNEQFWDCIEVNCSWREIYRIQISMFKKKHVFGLGCDELPSLPPSLPPLFLPSAWSKTLRLLWEVILLINMTSQAADVINQASSSNTEYLPTSRNNVDYITQVVLC